jgi:hypothetical protein
MHTFVSMEGCHHFESIPCAARSKILSPAHWARFKLSRVFLVVFLYTFWGICAILTGFYDAAGFIRSSRAAHGKTELYFHTGSKRKIDPLVRRMHFYASPFFKTSSTCDPDDWYHSLDYSFAKFNKKTKVLVYTPEEYEQYFKSDSWYALRGKSDEADSWLVAYPSPISPRLLGQAKIRTIYLICANTLICASSSWQIAGQKTRPLVMLKL